MATKKKTTPKRPYCAVCGGTNVTTTAWVEWRDDGTERPTNDCAPIDGDEGNWCSDCDENSEDGGHVEIIYPESMNTPAASKRRLANNAAREHGPELLDAVLAILAAANRGPVAADSIEIIKASELADKLTR